MGTTPIPIIYEDEIGTLTQWQGTATRRSGHFEISVELEARVSLGPKRFGDWELDSSETELGHGRKQPKD